MLWHYGLIICTIQPGVETTPQYYERVQSDKEYALQVINNSLTQGFPI